jgi:putative oxidoreductase
MNQIVPTHVLRILFAIPFVVFGAVHFMNAEQMKAMVPPYFPGDIIWVYITGIIFILVALAFVINKYAKPGGYLLAFVLLVFILTIHIPALLNGNQMALGGLLKDFALMAASMFIANFSHK